MNAGKAALPLIPKLFGMGDYTTTGRQPELNSLFSNGNYQFNRKPTIITNREYIGDVISANPNTFSYTTYPLNPGQNATFPWLASIASNFESYRFRGLVFEYKSMSADALNSVNTALGSVVLSVQYDAANGPFTYK
jgi:hypothetical protein